jgi:glycosyltransferase involved in cell wall biosynthesis
VQTYPYFEVIVVANGCEDGTVDVARDKCDKVIDLPERGLSRARNVGGAKARGELFVFLDTDTRLEPNALQVIAKEFTPEHASAAPRGGPDSPKLVYRAFYFYKNLLHRLNLHSGSSGVICCWRDQFKEAGGFDEELHGGRTAS